MSSLRERLQGFELQFLNALGAEEGLRSFAAEHASLCEEIMANIGSLSDDDKLLAYSVVHNIGVIGEGMLELQRRTDALTEALMTEINEIFATLTIADVDSSTTTCECFTYRSIRLQTADHVIPVNPVDAANHARALEPRGRRVFNSSLRCLAANKVACFLIL